MLDQVVEAVLAHGDAVALPVVTGSREQVWTARCVLADEERITTLAEALTDEDGPKVEDRAALAAVANLEESLGVPLTTTQHEVAIGLLVSGHRLDLVMGVAGSGKTTTLAAVREGFESAGYTVLGTATSGQAARNLGEGTGIESRTVASPSWRLDHNTLELSDRHVLILDEGATISDVDLARLLTAVERSGATLIVVGDDRQLGANRPGWRTHRPCRTSPRTALGAHRQPAPERPSRIPADGGGDVAVPELTERAAFERSGQRGAGKADAVG